MNLERNNIIMDKQLEKNLKKIEDHESAWQLNRVANALEEILKLVKQDMERMKKINEEN
jgi:hypothetical protein|tara:strand:- start:123 stop:299 length:177 start_codon:yes stop_codon:yes gene_type:complete